MKTYILTVTHQPINNTWGVLLRKGNIVHNEVDENLTIAFAEMAKYIENLKDKDNFDEKETFSGNDLVEALKNQGNILL